MEGERIMNIPEISSFFGSCQIASSNFGAELQATAEKAVNFAAILKSFDEQQEELKDDVLLNHPVKDVEKEAKSPFFLFMQNNEDSEVMLQLKAILGDEAGAEAFKRIVSLLEKGSLSVQKDMDNLELEDFEYLAAFLLERLELAIKQITALSSESENSETNSSYLAEIPLLNENKKLNIGETEREAFLNILTDLLKTGIITPQMFEQALQYPEKSDLPVLLNELKEEVKKFLAILESVPEKATEMPKNAEFKIPEAKTFAEIKTEINSEIKSEILHAKTEPEEKQETKQEIKAETRQDVKAEILHAKTELEEKQERRAETKPEAKAETRPDIKPDIKLEEKPEISLSAKTEPEEKKEEKLDIRQEMRQEIRQEARADIKAEIRPDIKPDIKLERKQEAKSDSEVKAETKLDIRQEMRQETRQEIKAEIRPEIRQEIKPDIKLDAKPEVSQAKSEPEVRAVFEGGELKIETINPKTGEKLQSIPTTGSMVRMQERINEFEVVRQVIAQAKFITTPTGEQKLSIQLHPEHLGQLNLRISLNNGEMQIHARVESPTAQAALENHIGLLREGLDKQGIHLERLEISIEQREQKEKQRREDKNEKRNKGRQGMHLALAVANDSNSDTGRRLGYNTMEYLA
jgi:flagellar hook-length control protein FliK